MIRKTIIWTIIQFALAAMCWLMYKYSLVDLFNKDITYIQWVAIVVIISLLLPKDLPDPKTKQSNTKITKNKEFLTNFLNRENNER